MSTSAIVIIKDQSSRALFFRPYCGDPYGVAKTLNCLMSYLYYEYIQNSVYMVGDFLLILGHRELNNDTPYSFVDAPPYGWRIGTYESAPGIPRNIDYIYEIDLYLKTLKGWKWYMTNQTKGEEVIIPLTKDNIIPN